MSVREDVLDLVRHLKGAAEAALRLPGLSDEEKLDLQRAADVLLDSAAKLLRIMDQHDALMLPAEERAAALADIGPLLIGGDVHLCGLLHAALTIGSRVLLDPAALRQMNEKAARAREAKAEKSKTKERDALIIELRAQGKGPKEIKSGLVERHNANSGWQLIKESAIRKTLKKLNL